MADTKISALAAIGTLHSDDLLVDVDVHDTSMAASGTDKKLTVNQLIGSATSGQLLYCNSSLVPVGAASILQGAGGQLNLPSISTPGSPVAGDMWLDNTQACFTRYTRGMTGFSGEMIYSQVNPVTLATSGATTLLSATNAKGTSTLAAGLLNVVGRKMVVKARGYATTPGATAGNFSLIFKLGSNIFAVTQSLPQNVSKTKLGFFIELDVICKTTGATGTIDSTGLLISGMTSSSGLTSSMPMPIQNGTVAATQVPDTNVTLDLTASYAFDLQWNYTLATSTVVLTSLDITVWG